MTNVFCPSVDCVNNKNLKCKSKNIELVWRQMATVNEGRVEMWICKNYEMSSEAKEMLDKVKICLESEAKT